MNQIFKKLSVILMLFLLILGLAKTAICQDIQKSIDISHNGKNKGAIDGVLRNGELFVNAKDMFKELNCSVRWYGETGKMKINSKAINAMWAVNDTSVSINKNHINLNKRAFLKKGIMYVPFSFFENYQIQNYFKKEMQYKNGKINLQKYYDINIKYASGGKKENTTSFEIELRKDISYKAQIKNRRSAEIVFYNADIKNKQNLRVNDKNIYTVYFSQQNKNAFLKVILKNNTKGWNIYQSGDKLIVKFTGTGQNLKRSFAGIALHSSNERYASVSSVAKKEYIAKPKETTSFDAVQEEAEELDADAFFDEKASTIKETKTSKEVVAPKPVASTEPVPTKTKITDIIDTSVDTNGRKMRIVIDPGHGGKDPGATRRRSKQEKDINLRISRYLADKLRKNKKFDVKLTRSSDKFIPLSKRAEISNKYKADLFVSIHTNAAKRKGANGFEVYILSTKATDKLAQEVEELENKAIEFEEDKTHYEFADVLLASLARNEFLNASSDASSRVRNRVRKHTSYTRINVDINNSIKQANFYVLRGVKSPGMLVELGYLSNSKDRKQLNNINVRRRLTQGIYEGIVDYAKANGFM